MDTLVNMGHVHAREIEDIVRRDELYNGTLTHMEVGMLDAVITVLQRANNVLLLLPLRALYLAGFR